MRRPSLPVLVGLVLVGVAACGDSEHTIQAVTALNAKDS